MFTPFAFRSIRLEEITPIGEFSAIGGQTYYFTTESITYKVHYFTSSGDFEVLSGTETIDYMIVGGGGGSAEFSGGGGAGGVLTGSLSVSPQTYSLTVGDGGPAVLSTAIGNQGTGSTAFGFTAIGGGAGAGSGGALAGGTGGSGGGGSPRNGGAGSGTPPQGQNGGTGRPGYTSGNDGGSGGGGGFSEVGANGGLRTGGDGGDGIDMSLVFGTTIGDDGWFAGGGGGMGDSRNGTSTAGLGGKGGGGLGGKVAFTVDNTAGEPNTGGGAGGGTPGGDGKAGGSGIVVVRYSVLLDEDAEAFLTATGITDPTITSAINGLVVDLKEATLWDKFIALYPFVGGTAFTQKWNLKNPQDTNAAYRLTFSGGITHSLDGIQGNGIDGFYNTHISGSDVSQDDASMFMYSRTNVAEAKADMGYLQNITTPFPGFQIVARSNVNTLQNRCNSSNPAGSSNTPNTNSIGVIGVYRDNSSNFIDFINKAETTVTKASVVPDPSRIYGLCFNLNGSAGFFSTKQQALAGVGSALSTSLLSDLVDINQTFQTALGRFV